MERNYTRVYYKDLTNNQKRIVNNITRRNMLRRRKAFINDPRYKAIDPEDVWYLKLGYINNWKHSGYDLFTKCKCGSVQFDLIMSKLICEGDFTKVYLYSCCKCGELHEELE